MNKQTGVETWYKDQKSLKYLPTDTAFALYREEGSFGSYSPDSQEISEGYLEGRGNVQPILSSFAGKY